MIVENRAELWLVVPGFDDLLLTGENYDDAGNRFTIEALDDGFSTGTPQPIDVVVQRWMTDGAVASTQGHENRENDFSVVVTADTSVALAAGEAALASRASRSCTLLWTGPEGVEEAPTSVFEVWTWHLAHTFNGEGETRLERTYTVTMTSKPWTRSVDLTTVSAVTTSSSPSTTVIDRCNAVSGSGYAWLTGTGGTPTIHSGAVHNEAFFNGGKAIQLVLVRSSTTAVTGLGSLPYLMIDFGATTSGYTVFGRALSAAIDGQPITQVATIGTTVYWQLPAGTTGFSALKVQMNAWTYQDATVALEVADVSATNVVGGVGSHKQLARTLSVGGSVPTSGSIKVASPTTALGVTMVYTCDGNASATYSPPLRQFRMAGTSLTVDTSAVSGYREALVATGLSSGSVTYQFPASSLPQASYAIFGRFYADGPRTLNAFVSAGIGSDQVTCTGTVTWTSGGIYQWGVLGVLDLPTPPVPAGSSALLNVVLSGTGTGSSWVDELYLLDVTHGSVSLVDCGSNTILWIDAPDADPVRNLPAIYVGTAADRSDAVGVTGAKILNRGDHDLAPGGTDMLTVCGVNDAAVSAAFYHRWHTHAGD